MISGAHVLIYSSNSAADTAFLRDVLALPHVDAGEGFLIFGLPPAEMAMHETKDGHANAGKAELNLVVDSIEGFVAAMQERAIACDPIADQGWGVVSSVTLPSGIKLGVYEPRHARPEASGHARGAVKAAAKAAKQAKKAAKALRATAKAVTKATKKATKATKKATKAAKKAKKRK
jgi:hypothetical protein